MKTVLRKLLFTLLLLSCLTLSSCNTNLGVGMSVGVPIGDHAHMSIGGGSWF